MRGVGVAAHLKDKEVQASNRPHSMVEINILSTKEVNEIKF